MSRNPLVMNPIKLFKLGQKYMLICPTDKYLAKSFPEIKIISYIKLANYYMGPTLVFLFFWQYYLNANLILMIISAVFLISLPIQGYLWLGKRATSPLPINLLSWYNHVKQKLIDNDVISESKSKTEQLDFIHFMQLITLAKNHFGNYFGEDDNNQENFN